MPAKRYDWDKLLSRSRFRLSRGIDYHCSTRGIVQQVRQAASKRSLHVRLVETDDWVAVLVLFEPTIKEEV